MSLLDTDFLLAKDRDMVREVCQTVFAGWGDHTQALTDCVRFYTLVLDEIQGPPITAEACESKIDLCLAQTFARRFPRRVRDFRLAWGETSLCLEIDLFKSTTADTGRDFPAIEWLEYDATVFERRLEEERISFQQLPVFWGAIVPCLKAVAKTIYNKAEHHPAFTVTLGIEEDTESCYLLFSHLDQISYAVLERLAEQAHIVDINARAWEGRLDIRVKVGGATPWALRSLAPKKHAAPLALSKSGQDKDKRGGKRRRT